jgi:hypothetical protein
MALVMAGAWLLMLIIDGLIFALTQGAQAIICCLFVLAINKIHMRHHRKCLAHTRHSKFHASLNLDTSNRSI